MRQQKHNKNILNMVDPPIAAAATTVPPPALPIPTVNDGPTPMAQVGTVGVAQNHMPASNCNETATPCRNVVHVNITGSAVSSVVSSAVSSLTNSPTKSTGRVPNHNKRTLPSSIREEDTPSSKKPSPPDFSKPVSDDKAYLSGDDSDAWGEEEERMLAFVNDQRVQEKVYADEMKDNDVDEIIEWEELAEGNILEGNPNDASPVNVKYETLAVLDKTYKLAELKAVAKEVGVGVSGTKAKVYRKI